MFTEENFKKIEELKKKYPKTNSLMLPVLWIAQEQFGWISNETMKYISELLNVHIGEVYAVATFYTMYNLKPRGKYHLQVCTNVSCMLRDSENILKKICHLKNIKLNETTEDKKFTLTEVECLGSCGSAPMMQINNDYYENLTVEKIETILNELK